MLKTAYDRISVLQAYLRQSLSLVIPVTPKEITQIAVFKHRTCATVMSAAVQLTREVYLRFLCMTTKYTRFLCLTPFLSIYF